MLKKSVVIIFAVFMLNHYAHAATLIIENTSDRDITAYRNHEWTGVFVKKGMSKVVFDKEGTALTALIAFEKGQVSSTVKKYKLKEDLLEKFNSYHQAKSEPATTSELKVRFPDDFDIEVSLRMRTH